MAPLFLSALICSLIVSPRGVRALVIWRRLVATALPAARGGGFVTSEEPRLNQAFIVAAERGIALASRLTLLAATLDSAQIHERQRRRLIATFCWRCLGVACATALIASPSTQSGWWDALFTVKCAPAGAAILVVVATAVLARVIPQTWCLRARASFPDWLTAVITDEAQMTAAYHPGLSVLAAAEWQDGVARGDERRLLLSEWASDHSAKDQAALTRGEDLLPIWELVTGGAAAVIMLLDPLIVSLESLAR